MAYELQKEVFAADSWKRLTFTENALLRTKELTRYVQKVIDAEKSTDLTYLNLYIDASNDVARRYVINPKMDRIVYPGTWRPVGNAIVNPQLPGYSQTLRLGFAQTIAWDEAFIVGGKAQKTYERDIAVEFRNFDPSSIEAGILSLLGQSPLTTITVDSNTIAGKWYVTGAEPRQEEDGSYTITAVMAYVQECANLAALSAMTALRESTRDVDHAFGFAGGYTAHNSVSNRDGIILTYRRIDPASKDVVSAFTDSELQSLLSAGEQATYEFVKKEFAELQDDHTYTLRVAFARVQRRVWDGVHSTADVVNYSNQGTPREIVDREWLGYQKSDLSTILAALVNGGAKDDLAGYVVTTVRYSDNDDGSLNFTQVFQRETKGALSSELELYQKTEFQPHGILPSACYLERMTIVNENLESRENRYTVRSAAYGLFKLVDTKEDLQGNGLWSVSYIYEKPTFVPWTNVAPDLVQYDNEGTQAQEQKRYWFAIRKEDRVAAIAALINGGSVGAPAGWVVTSIDVTDNTNGSLTFIQSIVEMVRGELNDEIEERKTRVVDVHGLKLGTIDAITIINRNLADKAAAYLAISSAFQAYVRSDYSESHQSNGLWAITATYELATWNVWTNAACDIEDYVNQGTSSEARRRTWLRIQKADMAAAIAALLNGGAVGAPAGWVVGTIDTSDNKDGSINIIQTIVEEVKGNAGAALEEYSKKWIEVFGFKSGTIETIRIINRNLLLKTDRYVAISAQGGTFTQVDYDEQLQGDGLWTIIATYQLTAWNAWTNATPDLVDTQNEGTVAESKRRSWLRIKNADKDTAVLSLMNGGAVGAPSGWVVGAIDIGDNKDGSITLTQTAMKMVAGSAASEIEEYEKQWIDVFGFRPGTMETLRIINRNLLSKANAYTTLSGAGSGYTQVDYVDSLQSDGLWTVTVTYKKASWTAWTNSAPDTIDYLNEDTVAEAQRRTWMRIQKADMGAAIAALLNGGAVGAPTGWVVKQVDTADGKDGSINLTQLIAKMVRGSSGSEIEEYDKKWVDRFGFQYGTTETVRIVNRDLKSKADKYVALSSAFAAYTQIAHDEQLQSDGLWTVISTYQQVSWVAWTNAAADLTQYQNPGTPVERRSRTWFRIKNADMATAITALLVGGSVGAPSGWTVSSVTTNDNKDGSINLEQSISLMTRGASGSELEEYNKKWIDRHGLKYGTIERVTIVNNGLKAKTDAYLVLSSSYATYSQVDRVENLAGDGLWSVSTVYEFVIWNAWTGAAADVIDTSHAGTRYEQHVKAWLRIKNADLTAAKSALATPTAGYVVTSLRHDDNKDGSFNIVQIEQYAATWSGTPATTYKTEERGIDEWGTKTTIHTFVSYAVTSSSMATAHANVKASYGPAGTQVVNIDINDRGNGIFDIIVTISSGNGITLPGWEDLGVEWHPLMRDQSGRRYNLGIRRTSSYTTAVTFAKGTGAAGSPTYAGTTPGYSIVYRDESVKEVGSNLWLAKRLEINNEDMY